MSSSDSRAVTVNVLKGGLGKSTVVKNTGASLAQEDDVLVMDLDDNGHLSKHLGFHAEYKSGHHFGEVIEEESDVGFKDIIYGTEFGFDFIPSTKKIDQLKGKFNSQFAPVQVLNKHLVEPLLGSVYDYILFDTPANRDLLTKNACVASQNLIVPLAPGKQMTDGLDATIDRIYDDMEKLGHPVQMMVLVPNQIEKRIDHQTYERELMERINTTEGLDQWVPNFARIPQDVWDAIDEGSLKKNPKPGIRKDKFVGGEKPVLFTDPTNENIQYFNELADIVRRGGVQREDGIADEIMRECGGVAL